MKIEGTNFGIEVSRLMGGTTVNIRTEVSDAERIPEVVQEIQQRLDTIGTLANASLSQQTTERLGTVSPSVALSGDLPEMPSLQEAPASYGLTDAITEVVNHKNSVWGTKPHTEVEIGKVLTGLGVNGVSKNLHGTIGYLLGKGVLKRQKGPDGAWQYYATPS